MDKVITLAHGSGGHAMQQLLEQEILAILCPSGGSIAAEDQARIPVQLLGANEPGAQVAMTTDSFVIDPIFFPGGDIGLLAVNGTVNDLAVGGARPLYLSCALILEEGLPIAELRRILQSIKAASEQAGVVIVTGDTKVVDRGSADKIFINTCGIGVIPPGLELSSDKAQPGDVLLVNGSLGDHGAAIMAARDKLGLDGSGSLRSDCNGLNHQIDALLRACPGVRCMRDATRGGLATILNEFVRASKVKIQLQQSKLPIQAEVQGLCELLGLDPLYLANEGKFAAVLPSGEANTALAALHRFPEARNAAIIGRVLALQESEVPILTMQNNFGAERIVDVLYGEQLPRIC